MASPSFYFLVIFSCFGLLLQNHVPFSSAETQCLNRKFKPDQKVLVEYFSDDKTRNPDIVKNLCYVMWESNNLISRKNRFGAEVTVNDQGELNCGRTNCTMDRELACFYKSNPLAYDECDVVTVTMDTTDLANCICNKDSDDILIASGKDCEKYKIPKDKLPALVVDGQYDPCLDTTNFDTMKKFFCTSYDGALPLC